MKSQNRAVTKYIENAARAFRDHEGVNTKRVRQWTEQFGAQHQNLAIKILRNINYYSASRIRDMVVKLVRLVCQRLNLRNAKNILFVPIGGAFGGSAVVARALRDIRGIEARQIKTLPELGNIPVKSFVRGIVLIDDFSGTGETFLECWEENLEPLLLPWDVPLMIGVLVLSYRAKEALKNLPAKVIYARYLDTKHNVLCVESKIFFQHEKGLLERFCDRTGCGARFRKGYRNCGLLVAFKHACPNNSLPILWCDSNRWRRLFKRWAL